MNLQGIASLLSPVRKKLLFAVKFFIANARYLFIVSCCIVIAACGAGSGEGLDANGNPVRQPGTGTDPYAAVQDIFSSRCTVCHAGASAPRGLILSDGQSHAAIVNVDSTQQNNMKLIVPNDPEASYLVKKILGDAGITGGQMPANGPPFLSSEQIQTIIDWVNAGAPAPTPIDPNAEFIADINDFVGYTNWQAIDYSIGPTNEALGAAHNGNVMTHSRRVFANELARSQNGLSFPNGSILVKEVVTFQNGQKEFAGSGGLLAMVKRGAGFNPDHGGWDWYILATDLSSIADSGANLMDGMCNACHALAAQDQGSNGGFGGVGYVFVHPSEHEAQASDFADYRTWRLIDDRNDANPLLDGMAHGANMAGSVRRVYKKQEYANPDTPSQGYPVGTTIVKEVLVNNQVTEVTAMVKRGGNFNPSHGSWEWFMLDPNTLEIGTTSGGQPARGADLMNNMCNGCHFAANQTSGNGIDYVFKHGGDPFNNNDEFVAQHSNFTDYQNWTLVDYTIGNAVTAIGGGHQGANDAYARKVFANAEAENFDGTSYRKGSIFVKEIFSWQTGQKVPSPQLGLVAMAKRGENFNANHDGWEWFELANDNSQILGRGGDYRNNGCNSCHQAAVNGSGGYDHVFDHPSEFVAESIDFSSYNTWTLIDERSDTNPLLGGMAHQANVAGSVRKVYKKQLYARPEAVAGGYPVGTVIVKEVSDASNNILEITAMVKRGGSFNNQHGKWEWFMLDTATGEIATEPGGSPMRGGDLMNGMCNSCHNLANGAASTEGTDFVFKHADDPFNRP